MKTKEKTIEIRKKRIAKVWRTYSVVPFFAVFSFNGLGNQQVY